MDPSQPTGGEWAQGWATDVDGQIFAQPLVVGGVVVVGTEHNSVYALDPATGNVMWHISLGFSWASSLLPCPAGAHLPEVGIQSTPVADTTTGVVYVVAQVADPNPIPGPFINPRHELFALHLSDGSILWHSIVDVPGTNPLLYNQEAGLVISQGKVYIPYGTYAGCEPFQGRLVAVSEDGSGSPAVFTVPANGAGGGIGGNGGLQAGAVSVDPSDGSLLVATGPGSGGTPDSASSVLRVSPALAELDSFTPTNWQALNDADLEMSSAPVLVGANRVFEMNQNGTGYLLNATALGGVGGQVYSAQVCAGGHGSVAVHGSLIYVPCTDSLVALSVAADGTSFSTVWSRIGSNFGTPIYAGGEVWSVANGGNLYEFDASTGTENIFPSAAFDPFTGALASGGGRLLVPTARQIIEFNSLSIVTTSVPDATAGQPYSTTLVSQGGTNPVRWLPASGSSLPPGLVLSPLGELSGTPRLAGMYTLSVDVVDITAPFNLTATRTLNVTVNPGLAITTSSLPDAQVGMPYSQALSAGGGVRPLIWSLGPGSNLPDGLALDSSGNVTGIPTTPGFRHVMFLVSDSAGQPATSAADIVLGVLPGAGADPGWWSFQHDALESGADSIQPPVATLTRGWTVDLDGAVVAQPLVVGGVVVVATEHDTLWALDPATGAVLWQNHLGDSIASNAIPFGCAAEFAPEVGIQSTPVVDTATGTLYVVAALANTPRHELFALKLGDGTILWHQGVDVPGTDPLFYNQEGGLVLSSGKVFIPYGTYAGCGPFQGRLVSVAEDGTGAQGAFTVPAGGGGGGIGGDGGLQGGVSVDPIDGSLLAATGTGIGAVPAGADSVLRLSPTTLSPISSFTPLNWEALNNAAFEMSSAPVLVGGNRVFEMNMNGTGYLLDAGTLGELYSAPVCSGGDGPVAVRGTLIYVPCTDGLVALMLSADGMSYSAAWAQLDGYANTPIYAGGLVWTHYSSGVLVAYDAVSGTVVFSAPDLASSPMGGLASGAGHLFVPTQRSIVAYNFNDTDLAISGVPANITVDASSPAGDVVSYASPTAVDEAGDPVLPSVSCAPASGSTFPIGTTTVTCTATSADDTPSSASATFSVTVNDTDLAISSVSANIIVEAASPAGTVVSYPSPTAVDEAGDPVPPTVSCAPASGSTFPIGTTTVTCTATSPDDTPSSATGSFTVTVNDTDLAITGVPASITAEAAGPKGTVITYASPNAIDESGDPVVPSVSCAPVSGSMFPMGTTTVTCTATSDDDTPTSAIQTFNVTVIDTTPPVTKPNRAPSPNPAGWNNSNVTVTLNAADTASGVRSITYSASGAQNIPPTTVLAASISFTVSGEGVTKLSFFATDNAGNVEAANALVINIDTVAPSTSCASPDGLWHATNVTIACTATDSNSGLATPAQGSIQLSTNAPAGTETAMAFTNAVSVCDVAGNCALAGPVGPIMVDRKPPSITIATPASGGGYTLNQTVAAAYNCVDGGSGIATCTGNVANGATLDTSTVGVHSFTVQATDQVGNASTLKVTYRVGYAICPRFSQTMPHRSGSTISVRMELCDFNGKNVSSAGITVHADSITPGNTVPSSPSNPGNLFNFDSTLDTSGGGYIYNLRTTGLATGMYDLNFTIAGDPTAHSVQFVIS